jgi:tRNA (guanine26-N2/guanine27-N2)-dimethyltransferase
MKGLRDISIAFIRALALNKPALLDSTSATGIRGIRYSKESGISNLTLLDVNKKAATNTRKNLKTNKVKAKILNVDLQDFVRGYEKKFNIIDLDPFGSPTPYIHDLLKISEDGTILMITATDTAVLCGAHSAACVKQYGSLPLHNELCKEVGIRILISYLIRKSAEFNFGITVMLSISDMHYMRVFIRLDKGAKKAYDSMVSTGFGSYCNKCSAFSFAAGIAPKLEAKCNNCGYGMQQFGPVFLGKLNDKVLLKKILDIGLGDEQSEKTVKLLYDEYETPFFYSLPKITRHLGISSVPYESVCKKLYEKGYTCSHTLFDINGLKTNAPIDKLSKAVAESKVK